MVKKITIKEIAQQAGVSIGTVDRVLHNRGGVSAKIDALVRKICKENNYESNVVGKAMAMQRKTRVVAVVINSRERNNFSQTIYEGIEKKAAEVKDYNIFFKFFDIHESTVAEMSNILDKIYSMDVSGLIIKPLDSPIIKYKLSRFTEIKKIPIITCTFNTEGIGSICYVGQDHFHLGRLFACTLTKILHDDMKIIVVVGTLAGSARREKLEGFLSYLKESKRKYEIPIMKEVPIDDTITYEVVMEQLQKHTDANVMYLHPPQLQPCLKALRDYGKFNGITCTFGHSSNLREYIKSGEIDFAIYEDPFNHGYYSGEIMFNYLLDGIVPKEKSRILEGRIIFDENC